MTLLLKLHDVENYLILAHRQNTYSYYYYLPLFRQEGFKAVHIASKNGHTEIVKLFLDRSADIEAADNVSYAVKAYYR